MVQSNIHYISYVLGNLEDGYLSLLNGIFCWALIGNRFLPTCFAGHRKNAMIARIWAKQQNMRIMRRMPWPKRPNVFYGTSCSEKVLDGCPAVMFVGLKPPSKYRYLRIIHQIVVTSLCPPTSPTNWGLIPVEHPRVVLLELSLPGS